MACFLLYVGLSPMNRALLRLVLTVGLLTAPLLDGTEVRADPRPPHVGAPVAVHPVPAPHHEHLAAPHVSAPTSPHVSVAQTPTYITTHAPLPTVVTRAARFEALVDSV